jgi:hypothetical protein
MPHKIVVPDKVIDIREMINDPDIQALLTKRPRVIAEWIDNNVNNLEDAKDMFKTLIKAILLLNDKIDRKHGN